jgi:hypothetical protein
VDGTPITCRKCYEEAREDYEAHQESHEGKVCWECKTPLNFWEFWEANKKLSEERAKELWEDPKVQFYCCRCIKDVRWMAYKEKWREIDKLFKDRRFFTWSTAWGELTEECNDFSEIMDKGRFWRFGSKDTVISGILFKIDKDKYKDYSWGKFFCRYHSNPPNVDPDLLWECLLWEEIEIEGSLKDVKELYVGIPLIEKGGTEFYDLAQQLTTEKIKMDLKKITSPEIQKLVAKYIWD